MTLTPETLPEFQRSLTEAGIDGWLPTAADREHVESLMVGVTEPGKMAGWLAAPATGIHAKPVDYDYVRT